ncbi:MAG: hypothetical protein ACI9JN_000407 [Bacteroidia bacterium]|jgi:hypothetical protein
MDLPISYSDVFNVKEHNFNEIALEIFRLQAEKNDVYRQYLTHIKCLPRQISHFLEIPFLPIAFFKTHRVITGHWETHESRCFKSSSTTGVGTSNHFYNDLKWYEASFQKGFNQFFGAPDDWCILALLPNYMENQNSSLITMVNALINDSNHTRSGFYLNENEALISQLEENEAKGIKTLLFGVTFALLDILPIITGCFEHLTIMETGGMKGRRKEITRIELHALFSKGFQGARICSEYGMTELFSQAYMRPGSGFETPPWMQVHLSQTDDPFSKPVDGKAGLINVIDLANIESCSFIATSDIGKMLKDGSFEVLGRFDFSEQRGCNLLIA